MLKIEWKQDGSAWNGHFRFLRPYRIVRRWFGKGVVLHCYGSRPRRRKFASVVAAKVAAERDLNH